MVIPKHAEVSVANPTVKNPHCDIIISIAPAHINMQIDKNHYD